MSTPTGGNAEPERGLNDETAAAAALLPAMSDDYRLTPDEVRGYRENGHVLLRGVASAEEVAAYRPVINHAAERFNTERRALAERDTYGKAFLQIMNLWTRDEGVRRFTTARRFAKIAADLMSVEAVRIYHDQALFKEQAGPRRHPGLGRPGERARLLRRHGQRRRRARGRAVNPRGAAAGREDHGLRRQARRPERPLTKRMRFTRHTEAPIPFEKYFKITIEHGHANHRADNYYTVAYWYQTTPHSKRPPLPPVADRVPKFVNTEGPTVGKP